MKVVQSHINLMKRAVKRFDTQTDAGNFFGIGQASVSRICNGKQEMPTSVRIVAALVVSGKIDV